MTFGSLNVAGVVIAALAVWRVTHLFWGEDGPGDVFVRLRRWAGQGVIGKLLDCFYCLSIWIAIPAALVVGTTWIERVLLWFGLSGAAIVIERVTSHQLPRPPTPIWREEPLPAATPEENREEEANDVLLR